MASVYKLVGSLSWWLGRTLRDPWIPNEVGQALRNSNVWHRDGAQPAVFRWNPFSMYFGHMGDGKARREAVAPKAASPPVLQLCRRPTAAPRLSQPRSCRLPCRRRDPR